MNFFYVYFSDERLEQLRTLILSILTVRRFYPLNEIVVIDYSNDRRLHEFSKLHNFQLVQKSPCYMNKNHIINNMVSKPMDCILVAESLNMNNIVLLDSDVFLLDEFSTIDFDKFSIFHREKTGYNSGILFFSTKSESLEAFKEMYGFVVDRCNESVEFVHFCQKVFNRPLMSTINEETLIGAMLESLPVFKKKHSSNIDVANHGHLDFFLNQSDAKFNNLHFLAFVLNNLGAASSDKYQYPLMLKEFNFLKVDEDFFGIKPSFNLNLSDLRAKLIAAKNKCHRMFL